MNIESGINTKPQNVNNFYIISYYKSFFPTQYIG